MTTMQFPFDEYSGIVQDPLYDFGSDETNRKLKLPDDYVTFKELPFEPSSPLFFPFCTSNIIYTEFHTSELDLGRSKEMSWLDSFDIVNIENCVSWSKFHSISTIDSNNSHQTAGRNALMPMISKKVASLKAQFHCMNLIKKTISFINQDQIPVDVDVCTNKYRFISIRKSMG